MFRHTIAGVKLESKITAELSTSKQCYSYSPTQVLLYQSISFGHLQINCSHSSIDYRKYPTLPKS